MSTLIRSKNRNRMKGRRASIRYFFCLSNRLFSNAMADTRLCFCLNGPEVSQNPLATLQHQKNTPEAMLTGVSLKLIAKAELTLCSRGSPNRLPYSDQCGLTLTRRTISSAASKRMALATLNTPITPPILNITPPTAAPVAMADCTDTTTIPPALSA